MKARLAVSLLIGVVAASVLVAFESRYRRAALLHSAALNHQTPGHILVSGFAGTMLIAAGVVFVFMTVRAHRPRRGSRSAQGAAVARYRTPAGRR